MIYFVHCRELAAIKIGYSKNPKGRFGSLQTSCPVPLVLLGVIQGDTSFESVLHQRFSHLRLCGEWFRDDSELTCFIEMLIDKTFYLEICMNSRFEIDFTLEGNLPAF